MEFVYALIECFCIVYTPRALSTISGRPLLLKVLLFFDVLAGVWEGLCE